MKFVKEIEMNKMSVTRALAELKRLDDRLNRMSTDQSIFVSVAVGQGDKQKVLGVSDTVQNVVSQIQSNRDRVNSMIEMRAKIKSAVVASNAATKVKLGAREMTVAEAIELKKSIEVKRNMLSTYRRQVIQANALVAKQNAALEAQIETNLATIYGNEKGKVDASMFEAIAKPQREQKEASLIDPIKINDLIKSLEEEISLVETELDFTLSEINAKTEIEV